MSKVPWSIVVLRLHRESITFVSTYVCNSGLLPQEERQICFCTLAQGLQMRLNAFAKGRPKRSVGRPTKGRRPVVYLSNWLAVHSPANSASSSILYSFAYVVNAWTSWLCSLLSSASDVPAM